jgi:hypothetical protein
LYGDYVAIAELDRLNDFMSDGLGQAFHPFPRFSDFWLSLPRDCRQ